MRYTNKQNTLFMFVDGDSIGAMCGRAVLANDVEKLRSVSSRIDAAQEFIQNWCSQVGGMKISGGGDEASMEIPESSKYKIEELRVGIEKSFGYTISVGVGRSLSEAGTALLVAKLRGKDRIVYFNKKIKKDIQKAKRRVREKRASVDENKLAEAYLKKADNMICDLHKNESGRKKRGVIHEGIHEFGGQKHHVQIHSPREGVYSATVSPGESPVWGSGSVHTIHAKQRPSGFKISHEAPYTHQGRSNSETSKEARGFVMGKIREHAGVPTRQPEIAKSEESMHDGAADKEGLEHQHPDNEDNRTDDCQYCADLDAEENADGTAGMHDCPACADYDAKNGTSGGIEGCQACKDYDASQQNTGGIDDCPYCQSENITESQANPEQEQDHICNCPNCPKKDETGLAVEDMAAERPDNCPQCQEMYGDAIEEQPGQTGQEDPNLQGHETAEEVLDLLDNEPGASPTPAQAAKKIDNTELPQGDQMKGNTSVPEDFGPAQSEEVSDSEQGHDCNCPDCPGSQEAVPMQGAAPDAPMEEGQDEPDMAGVLQNGLDDHANEQKKQQVLDMVGQTLAGFKANKASLEATKEQNQALYNSCIQMLKSMIALCDLLGLKPQAAAQAAPVAESATPEQPPAAPREGSPDPKAMG